jgi:hypothetical protein
LCQQHIHQTFHKKHPSTEGKHETQVVGNVTICGDASHPSLEILDKVDAWHWKMLSSLQESFNKTLKSKES